MIKLGKAFKIYSSKGSSVNALNGVSLTLGETGFVCVLGASGCGKTTLLNILGGLDTLTSGSMQIGGRDCSGYGESEWNAYRNNSVGFVFQECCLIPHINLLENVGLTLALSGEKSAERKRLAIAALSAVGLEKIAYKKPSEVSGGEAQRAAIARAIVNEPRVVLADEPTGALDSVNGDLVAGILKDISKTRLVVMVTHNRHLAEKYATRIIEMSDGKIISDTGGDGGVSGNNTAVGRTKMDIPITLGLSARNLAAKKFRSAVISAVGSLGMIAVCVVIALSSWFTSFVERIENRLLYSYGIVAGGVIDMSSITNMLLNLDLGILKPKVEDALDMASGEASVDLLLSDIYASMDSSAEIDADYLEHINALSPELYRYISKDYGFKLRNNIFTTADISGVELNVSLDYITGLAADYSEIVNVALTFFDPLAELPGSKDAVDEQFELVYGKYPEDKSELIFVLNEDLSISDYVLALLGYYSLNDITAFLQGKTDGLKYTWTYDELVGKKFSYFDNDLVYELQSNKKYVQNRSASKSVMPLDVTEDEGLQLTVCGVLRSKSQSSGLMSGLYYTEELTEYALTRAARSNIVSYMLDGDANGKRLDPFSGVSMVDAQWLSLLRSVGGMDMPSALTIFASSVENKQKILAHLEKWNTDNPDKAINYADYVNVLTGIIISVIDNATAMLMVLAAVSVLVTAVMTGVVSYMSVKQRAKEIGVLRSIGAGKADIIKLFSFETAILGLLSGIFGIAVSYIAAVVIGAAGLISAVSAALLPWWAALACIGANVVLNTICGLIPAFSAARQNPVTALRNE